jgi:hypothetical protein
MAKSKRTADANQTTILMTSMASMVGAIGNRLPKPKAQTVTEDWGTFLWEEVTLTISTEGGVWYLSLTKKEPRETIHGVTKIAFTGLKDEMVEPFFGFIIERAEELLG